MPRPWCAAGRVTDDDVAGVEPGAVVTGPIGDDPAGFTDQQGAGGDVPRAEGELEVAVEDPGCGPGEIEAGRAGAAQVLEAFERRVEHGQVARPQLGMAERKAGRADRGLGLAVADRDSLPVAVGAAAGNRGECG